MGPIWTLKRCARGALGALAVAALAGASGCAASLGALHGRASEPTAPGDPVAALEAARRAAPDLSPGAADGGPAPARTTPIVGRRLEPLSPPSTTPALSASAEARPAAAPPLAPPLAPPPPPAPARSVLYAVHLASYRQDALARDGWTSLQARAGGALSDLAPRLESADLGARGVFVRLKAGPLPSRRAAEERCVRLEALGLYCQLTDFHGRDVFPRGGQAGAGGERGRIG